MRYLPWLQGKEYPLLIDRTWQLFQKSGLAWEIENVEDAPMPYSITLCGLSFGLPLYRHRRFGTSHLLMAPSHQRHTKTISPGRMLGDRGRVSSWERASRMPAVMGCPWMTQHEVSQAIPPAYTQWIGAQLLTIIEHSAA
jgi:DNA (cytosine-5)-methyltransferase 1